MLRYVHIHVIEGRGTLTCSGMYFYFLLSPPLPFPPLPSPPLPLFVSQAREEPGICEPFINGPWVVTDLQNSFLLLMSDGLYEAYGAYIDSENPQVVHEGIAAIVVEEMKNRTNVNEIAQATVDQVTRLLKSRVPGARLDDITLIINYFGHSLRGADQVDTPITGPRPSLYGENGGGEFVPEDYDSSPWQKEPAPSSENELVQRMEDVNISQGGPSQGGPSRSDPVFPSPVELTEEQKQTGKFIVPYILFPLSFPYEKGLDEF